MLSDNHGEFTVLTRNTFEMRLKNNLLRLTVSL